MNKSAILSVLFSSAVIILVTACIPVDLPIPPQPLVKPQNADEKMAKNTAAPADKAVVYLYRSFITGSTLLTVELDGEYAGNTSGGTYFMWLLAPGKHDFASIGGNTSTMSLEAKAGETYYIWQEIKWSWRIFLWQPWRTELHLVDEETGRKGMKLSRLLQNRADALPLAPRDRDMMVKNMSAPMDKAIVYLYRNEDYLGCRTLTVTVDGMYAGRTIAKTYLMWLLSPGKHDFASIGGNISTVSIDVRAGETYYIWQDASMPWRVFSRSKTIHSELHIVDKEKGHDGVVVSNLVDERSAQ